MPPKEYQLLPTGPMSPSSNTNTHSWPVPKWMPRHTRIRPRQFVTAVSTLTLFATITSFFYWNDLVRYTFPERSPWASDATNFDEVFLRESTLPQHDLSAPFPEGKNGRYVRFSNQVWGLGWNNILQERLLNTILAYESNRAPVFTPFEAWAHPPRNDSDPNGERKVLSIPYNALVSGPTAGGSWGSGDRHPRAVTDKWWEVVCPLPNRVVIKAEDVISKFEEKDLDGKRTVQEWSSLLRDIPENCVEIVGTQIFDFYLIGSTRVLPLWDDFSKHPAITRLDDSEIVKAAVQRNIGKLQAVDGFSWRPAIWQPKGTIAGLAAVHLRRGDYLGGGEEEGHCVHLSKWGSTYTGWNQLPQLYDTFTPPPRKGVPWGENTPEVEDYYLQRCLPTPKQVASRLRTLQSERRTRLSHVYVATNAEQSYLDELRTVLTADGWSSDAIVTSRDLQLNWQAESVAMAVDMSILSRAELFIGNGFSSMTSNVVMKRLTTGMPLDSVRFW